MIAMTLEAARRKALPVNLCGQMSGNPVYTMLLLGMGLRQLSVPPSTIPEIKKVCRPEIALLPIGAYNPPQFRNVHTSPADATRAFLDLHSQWMVPMHYGTFRLSHEPIEEPLQLLEQEAKAAGVTDQVVVLEEGVTRFF